MSWTPWTPKIRDEFLAELARTGNVTLSARSVGISRSRAYQLKEEDPEFAALWEEAEAESTDMLEAEARRRGENGVLEPVFYRGEECGTIRKYSDTLLLALLNARSEKFRKGNELRVKGKLEVKGEVNLVERIYQGRKNAGLIKDEEDPTT